MSASSAARRAIAAAKGELVEALPAEGVAVLNADDPLVAAMAERTAARVLTFGPAEDADVRVGDVALDATGHLELTLVAGVATELTLAAGGRAPGVNGGRGSGRARPAGWPVDEVADALRARSSRGRGGGWRSSTSPAGVTVVNDAYNANPDSMRAALDALVDLGRQRGGAGPSRCSARCASSATRARPSTRQSAGSPPRSASTSCVVVGEGARAIHRGAVGDGLVDGESGWVADADAAIARPGRGGATGRRRACESIARGRAWRRVALAVLADERGGRG